MKAFSNKKQKLKKSEIEAVLNKIRAEYDKYIVTYHKSAALKKEFERRLTNAKIESRDMEKFLQEEIAAIQAIFIHQKKQEKERALKLEAEKKKAMRKTQPDFADIVLEKLKSRITAYPPLRLHKEASYEIEHLYGAVRDFESRYWPGLDNFISRYGRWSSWGEKRDFNNDFWRFIPSGKEGVPQILERYLLLLNSTDATLKEISLEAQRCIKEAAFLLNDIIWSCREIIQGGIDSSEIEKNLDFVQNIVKDFRLKDLRNQ